MLTVIAMNVNPGDEGLIGACVRSRLQPAFYLAIGEGAGILLACICCAMPDDIRRLMSCESPSANLAAVTRSADHTQSS